MKMAGHVYLIGSRLFGWYKIGKSSNASHSSLYQIFSVPRSIEKKIDRLVKAQKQAEQRAYTAEQRAVELEALLKSIELPKI